MRISDWSSDVCSSDLLARADAAPKRLEGRPDHVVGIGGADRLRHHVLHAERLEHRAHRAAGDNAGADLGGAQHHAAGAEVALDIRSEEHTSELQSLMSISYAVFCLKKKNRIYSFAHPDSN